jgi:hypothetical protein
LGHFTNEFPQKVFLDVGSIFFFNDHNAVSQYTMRENRSILLGPRNDKNEIIMPFFVHFHGLCLQSSIPPLNFGQEHKMFEIGTNYKQVGKQILGDDLIVAFPPHMESFTCATNIERGVLIGLVLLLLVLVLFVRARYKRRHG